MQLCVAQSRKGVASKFEHSVYDTESSAFGRSRGSLKTVTFLPGEGKKAASKKRMVVARTRE